MRLAVDVTGEVLGRPAELEQRLLEVAALEACTTHGVVVDARTEHRRDPLGAQHLLEHGPVAAGEHQTVGRVLLEAQPAVPVHRLGDVDEQCVGHGVAGERQQGVDDLLGVVPGGARVPEPERGEPVGVDVLGRPLELRERRDRLAAVSGVGVVDLEQQGLVGLDDERSVGSRLASGLSPGAVGGDVGPRRASVGAVAPRLVGGGVDEHVGARRSPEHTPRRVAPKSHDEHSQTQQTLRGDQLGDTRPAVGNVQVPRLRVVADDSRCHRVPAEQGVEQFDDLAGLTRG